MLIALKGEILQSYLRYIRVEYQPEHFRTNIMLNKKISFLFIFLFSLLTLSAKPFVTVSSLSGDNDDIQGKIANMIQDKKGFIWFSSFNGLHKYDGYKITKYKSIAGAHSPLVSNRISLIKENSNGDIWCISGARLYLFRQSDEQFLDVQSMFEKSFGYKIEIMQIFTNEEGYSWMISKIGECFKIKDNAPLERCVRFDQIGRAHV